MDQVLKDLKKVMSLKIITNMVVGRYKNKELKQKWFVLNFTYISASVVLEDALLSVSYSHHGQFSVTNLFESIGKGYSSSFLRPIKQ